MIKNFSVVVSLTPGSEAEAELLNPMLAGTNRLAFTHQILTFYPQAKLTHTLYMGLIHRPYRIILCLSQNTALICESP